MINLPLLISGFIVLLVTMYKFFILQRANRIILFLTSVVVMSAILVCILLVNETPFAQIIFSIMIFGAISELFLFIITLVENSLSLKALEIICEANGKTKQEVFATSNAEEMISARLDRLLKANFIKRRGEYFDITGKGKTLVLAFDALARVFGREPSSFEIEK